MAALRTGALLSAGMLGALWLAPAIAATPAALVEFAIGSVSAVDGAGGVRPLAKGTEIQSGDTVDTGESGRVQLRFSDGAYISLQPGSQFRIDEYNYTGKSDSSERGFFSLLKGGLRTITGLIGRTNRRNYQVRVPVATIGIRGTEYTLSYDGQARGTVGEGEISVCNSAGCLYVKNGQSYVVPNANVKPELTSVRSFLSAPPPPSYVPRTSAAEPGNPADSTMDSSSVFSSNDQVDPVTGLPRALGTPPTPPTPEIPLPIDLLLFGDQRPPPSPPVTNQSMVLATTAAAFNLPGSGHEIGTAVVPTIGDVETGVLVSWTDGADVTNSGTTSVLDHGNTAPAGQIAGVIAWGRFVNGTLGGAGDNANLVLSGTDSFHYIVAKPTPPPSLPVTGSLTFNTIVGKTTPTTDTSTAQLLSAGLLANFTRGTVQATVSLLGPDSNRLNFLGSSVIAGSLFGGGGNASGTACPSGCGGSFSGVFAGPQAQFAGFTYDVEGTSFGGVRGAVVLRR
jgi:hypothetical protein